MFRFFKDINSCQDVENIGQNIHENNADDININILMKINGPILWTEIEKAVRSLKNNKSSGLDEILNEHIKSTYNLPSMRNVLLKIFNIVFDSKLVPTQWSIGIIIPIYKEKGNKGDAANYRQITLLSCMGKLFTCIINNRFKPFSESQDKITQCQAGFRKGFSTIDHIFALNTLVNLAQNKRRSYFVVS